ncbi:Tol-pal system-associated acyl-CoA thioesterase [Methyloglobulus morosus KoM1]|uniref:Tol-pal system-associated acyl-CoA thioesterase n=1 Tax=Methyloglobulus morosus KoM1 TaxID=1116472 RepID=V5C7H3_9GAMM|nr:tol-pal system-associated acyl-CoA thioesterase [Methyloglobulus morosus]ESS72678.1 Tol-pal system-associated acyl-CoA thioesterase [Methyloglobulus morosus KoM1]
MTCLNKPFVWPIRVYYEDTDAGGVVFYANYLKYMERARTELLRTEGFEQDELMTNDGIVFAVRSLQVEYRKPARFNQLLQVSAEINQLKKASLEFAQLITHDEQLLVTADVRIACLDINTMKPKAIPDHLIRAFSA